MKHDDFGDRMKKYEAVSRTYLIPKVPVIIRVDGKAFHTFTRGFNKPFDPVLVKAMQDTTMYLCENIQGCVLGYTQSDEITLVLIDYQNINSNSWFGYNVQKCVSIAASMATMSFNKFFDRNFTNYFIDGMCEKEPIADKHIQAYSKSNSKGAMFDARCFNVPKEEVCNNLLWRQNDAIRNSIQMVGHANFSDKELYKKSCEDIKEMLLTQKGIDWSNYPTHLQRGSCCIKRKISGMERPKWDFDTEIPIFKGEGRKYIEDLIYI